MTFVWTTLKDTVRVLKFWLNSILFLKWSENRTDTLEVLSLLVIIKNWIWSFPHDNFFRWVIPMTSSIFDSNMVCKNTRRCLTPKPLILLNFGLEEYFISPNTEKVISSFCPEYNRKVRKLSIWFKEGKMSPVDLDDIFPSDFRST